MATDSSLERSPPGRVLVVVSRFNEAVTRETLPDLYRFTDGWDAQYEKYHWPAWWKALFVEAGLVEVIECRELEDGVILWEDDVLYGAEKALWRETYFQKAKWLIDHLAYGRDHRPYLTHFVAVVEKR